MDLAVLPLAPTGGHIKPPTMFDAYWITDYGRPGAGAHAPDNTVYIAAHSRRSGGAAFNPLLDSDYEGATLRAGDAIELTTPSGIVNYRVTEVERIDKEALPTNSGVWEIRPGRLILVTCFQRNDGRRSTENLLVYADMVA